MKRSLLAFILIPLALISASCKSGGPTVTPTDVTNRVLADLGCVTAAAAAGLTIAGDPSVGGVKTVTDVLHAISSVGGSNVPAAVLAACQQTIAYAQQDYAGLVAQVKTSTGTTTPTVTPAAQRKPSLASYKQPAVPTVVTVPLK